MRFVKIHLGGVENLKIGIGARRSKNDTTIDNLIWEKTGRSNQQYFTRKFDQFHKRRASNVGQ